LSADTGKKILSKLESLTTRLLEMSSKQAEISSKLSEMNSKQQEMAKDLYNIKIVVGAVGMATGLVLTASRFLTLNFKN